MNSFYHFINAVDSKQKNKAMLILRDKTESVARKIMEKAKIQVPDYKGRLFWKWAQDFIIRTCTHSEENHASLDTRENTLRNADPQLADTQSGCGRRGEAHGITGYDYRSREYRTDAGSPAGAVCPGTGSLPAFYAGLGHACYPHASETAAPGKPALDMGPGDTTGVHSDISGPHSLVRPEHPFRIRQCHATARLAAPGRPAWHGRRRSAHYPDGVATDAGKLRDARSCTGLRSRHLAFRCTCSGKVWSGLSVNAGPVAAQRRHTSAGQSVTGTGLCNRSHTVAPSGGRQAGQCGMPDRCAPVYARRVLLAGVSRPPGRAAAHSLNVVARSVRSGKALCRSVRLSPAEIECFCTLPLDDRIHRHFPAFMVLAMECRRSEGLEPADTAGLLDDIVFYSAMFGLFLETGRMQHPVELVKARYRQAESDTALMANRQGLHFTAEGFSTGE